MTQCPVPTGALTIGVFRRGQQAKSGAVMPNRPALPWRVFPVLVRLRVRTSQGYYACLREDEDVDGALKAVKARRETHPFGG